MINNDSIEYAEISVVNTQWVEKCSLPTYSNGENKFAKLNHNYSLIKHMMGELGLRLNYDYIIIPNTSRLESIDVKFSEQYRHYASMCVLLWGRYKTAKIESNL